MRVKKIIEKLKDQKVRNWLYKIAIAVGGLLVVIGVGDTETVNQVLLVVAAILGLGGNALASRNSAKDVEVTRLGK